MPAFTTRLAQWEIDRETILAVRRIVFIEEQEVPETLEIDGRDMECIHALAFDGSGNAIGTARLMPEARIGRVAVLEPWRKQQVGTALMRMLMGEAQRAGIKELELHAQTWTIGFYSSLGFEIVGEEFEEACIPHQRMVWRK